MDKIRADYDKSAIEWAVATWGAAKFSSRISELRLKLDMHRLGNYEKTGRAFSVSKCVELLNGLKGMLGEKIVRKELKKLLAKAHGSTERMVLMVLSVPEEDKERVETVIKAVTIKEK